MKKIIDFTKIPCYTDITRTKKKDVDIRYDFSNAMYVHGNGIAMGALAMKIYNSSGEEEYSDEEQQLILQFAANINPVMRDSLIDIVQL